MKVLVELERNDIKETSGGVSLTKEYESLMQIPKGKDTKKYYVYTCRDKQKGKWVIS